MLSIPNFDIEDQLSDKIVVGIDEAGRGPWAGPLVVAAILLDRNCSSLGINDSKLLCKKKREAIYEQLILSCKYGVGIASVFEIDELKLTKATELAITRALSNLNIDVDMAIIDGNLKYNLPVVHIPIIKGDQLSLSIAASSIIAKVERDKIMTELSLSFSPYLWHKNFGYGTLEHIKALDLYGATIHHRKSFKPIQKYI